MNVSRDSLEWGGKIRVGDTLTNIRQNGIEVMDERDNTKPAYFMVTAITHDGDIELRPIRRPEHR